MKLRPIADNIIVDMGNIYREELRGGIIVPNPYKEACQTSTVLAVGDDETLRNNIKVGDKVVYKTYAGQEYDHEGVTHLFLRKKDIIVVITEGE